ncbi:hypothetical protein S820908_078 [Synechococcus phage S-CAM9]|uniref:Neck protein n=1 Tax=Synechococcus phage S-CAM9 TaxID=1883369 RepID=A0A1D8KQ06_9CAUD|nr:head-tail adaptor Ad2 [Synechococcus phage S-CAM9]AOV60226.1 hypothetical protein S050808_079 [Synechococcus phage S-CAM9]AOV60453.1 hypothetical protein S820908_078 [Synechococcus phage S-CAM9]AOV60682.1 hypothetical protein N161109_079 [Synechococcus phage S-CAM9]
MAKPSTRQELIDYCLRQLGEPVLEVNVDEDQIDDLVDDALQYFQERHMDGVERMFLKHQVQQWEIDAARTKQIGSVGIHSQSFNGSSGVSTTANNIVLPNHGLATGTQVFYSFNSAATSIGISSDIVLAGVGTTSFLGIGTDSVELYAIADNRNEIRVAASLADAKAGTAITFTNVGVGSTHFISTKTEFTEARNYIEIPDHVIGVQGIFRFDDNTISQNMFSISYQIFLNDVYNFSSVELLNYTMVKSYLETIQFLVSPDKKVRFNKRGNRLYIDMDWASQTAGDYLVIDCYRILDPTSNSEVYNDSYLKRYLTSLIKRQWGQNLMKFQGVQLPGGITLNGRQLYEDALRELAELQQRMTFDYELPPLDMIG